MDNIEELWEHTPTKAALIEGSNIRSKIMNMTDAEVHEYIHKLKMDSYQEGYSDCFRKETT